MIDVIVQSLCETVLFVAWAVGVGTALARWHSYWPAAADFARYEKAKSDA